ncbi:cystathionine beta-lyase [Caldanaerobacter subterraneus subsp. yonseiensis KB-1]|uniref:homocysteine desulfhydrase n=1 Tax=Caldanaerobacter subterraneus subsp. yonseiensis KB-1 TaxID=1388761 RepID=U5CV57_CALSX|nr:PLP-dependent aspartate aminotransferase family protein [Caldanaerobacter subterraneus]ERM91957.1 cystathionine beta-lyase [Caldanaerobacter subterraneus subsp. yonseiensis KB-1]
MELHFKTKVVHIGNYVDEKIPPKPKTLPIYQTSVFTFDTLEEVYDYLEGNPARYMYTRLGNPNQTAVEELIANLEGAEAGQACASGMAAISSALLAEVNSGDHIIAAKDIYGGTNSLFNSEFKRLGIEISLVDFSDLESVEKAIKPNTKVIYMEIMTNPLIRVFDVEEVVKIAKRHGLKLIVDNTFTTPYLIRPLEVGAYAVIHSATKYINGHSDVIGGLIAGNKEFISRTRRIVHNFGGSMSPFDAWLTLRGAKTLFLRMREHCKNAMRLAEFLESHPKVKKVFYPGLPSHPDYSIAKKLFKDEFGGMLSFEIDGGEQSVNRFMQELKLIKFAPSLAGVQTMITHPKSTSHRALSKEELQALGISEGLIRVSVGIEEIEDVINDFKQALDKV